MNVALDYFIAITFVAGFVLFTSVVAVGLGAEAAVPASVLRFLRGVAGGGELVPRRSRGLTVVFFVALSLVVIAVPVSDLLQEVPRADLPAASLRAIQLLAYAVWSVYLAARSRDRRERT